MEPLLRNIDKNDAIEPIYSTQLNSHLPKAYGYADDINGTFKYTREGVRNLFKEYGRLTRQSGLQLNADKTEIMPFASQNLRIDRNIRYDVVYMNKHYNLTGLESIKINGIYFQQNAVEMRRRNLESVERKIDDQLKKWSRRGLSLLGKILIMKTFGVSQIIYLLQSLVYPESELKNINLLLYKFLWNRHYSATKAPERIKREIINKPINLGGFGMLNINELDESLKIRALGRAFESKHEMVALIRNKMKLRDFFFPKLNETIDRYLSRSIELLGLDRRAQVKEPRLENNPKLLSMLRESNITSWIRPQSKNSLTVFRLRMEGKTKIKHLEINDVRALSDIISDIHVSKLMGKAINFRQTINLEPGDFTVYHINAKPKLLSRCTSKEIRNSRQDDEPICIFKIGLLLSPSESKTWCNKIRTA